MAKCNICDGNAGLTGFKTQDGWICRKCFKKCGFTMLTPIMSFSTTRIKQMLEDQDKNSKEVALFTATKTLGGFLEIDEANQKVKIINTIPGQRANFKVYRYIDILDCDLIEDTQSITKGGLASALVGGALAGGVGAIVGSSTGGKVSKKGAVNELTIKITVNDLTSPTAFIQLIGTKTKTSSPVYINATRYANDILSAMSIIMRQNLQTEQRQSTQQTNPVSIADELLKLKQLLDSDLITQAEFDAQKQKLLG